MTAPDRDTVQKWINNAEFEAYICPDCEGVHITVWESKDAVLEARFFVEPDRVSFLVEIAIRPSAVLPLQGAVHFMNYDYGLVKVMLAMADNDVPRLLLTHALPAEHLSEPLFKQWFSQLNAEMEAVYKHISEMEVLHIDDDVFLSDFDDQLH